MKVTGYDGPAVDYPLAVPLLDLVLVVVLVVLSTISTAGASLESDGIRVTDQPAPSGDRVISLRPSGKLFVNGRTYTLDEFRRRVDGDRLRQRSITLLVSSETPFVRIRKALAVLAQIGFEPQVNILVGRTNTGS